MEIRWNELDAFVAETDRLGGPGTPQSTSYWQNFRYLPTCRVDVSLDPDGLPYFEQMMDLYRELSGRELDPAVTELTAVDVDDLAPRESPYAHTTPSARTVHYLRLAKAVQSAELPRNGRVLDMGSGWGLSSEFLAQLGFNVVSVDINPSFSELVRRRAQRLDLPIRAITSSFDALEVEPSSFDAVLFYECFHHAAHPSELLAKVRRALRPGGKLMLAGEPIQADHWPSWGLRLDALSVYCVRKFGWFESGWSAGYLQAMLTRNGIAPTLLVDPDPTIGAYVIGSRSAGFEAATIGDWAAPEEWWLEGSYLVSGRNGRRSTLVCAAPQEVQTVTFEIHNFKPEPMDLSVRVEETNLDLKLAMGRSDVSVVIAKRTSPIHCEFSCEPWSPAELVNNGDPRHLGFHLRRVVLE